MSENPAFELGTYTPYSSADNATLTSMDSNCGQPPQQSAQTGSTRNKKEKKREKKMGKNKGKQRAQTGEAASFKRASDAKTRAWGRSWGNFCKRLVQLEKKYQVQIACMAIDRPRCEVSSYYSGKVEHLPTFQQLVTGRLEGLQVVRCDRPSQYTSLFDAQAQAATRTHHGERDHHPLDEGVLDWGGPVSNDTSTRCSPSAGRWEPHETVQGSSSDPFASLAADGQSLAWLWDGSWPVHPCPEPTPGLSDCAFAGAYAGAYDPRVGDTDVPGLENGTAVNPGIHTPAALGVDDTAGQAPDWDASWSQWVNMRSPTASQSGAVAAPGLGEENPLSATT